MSHNIIIRDKGAPHISEVIDIKELTELFQSYSDITGMVTALLDLEGEILIATNWQDSCTQFHRLGEVTSKRCHESDTALAGSLAQGDEYNVYRCRNGLVDVATPVVIGGQHMANFFTGQFFFEKPDLEYFSKQADEAGFEKDTYLEAINKVPIYDDKTIKAHMAFLIRIAEMIGKSGAANLRALQANQELKQHKEHLQALVDERTAKLEKSLKTAEAANIAKSKFLSNMSHELRTPLNAVLGYSEILGAKESEPSKKRYLESINLSGKGLLALINSVLDISKIESGKMPIQKEPMSLASLVQEMEVVFRGQAAEKDLSLRIAISPQVPKAIHFDETKLRQILINLVGNAIKFTNTGFIEICVQSKIFNEAQGSAAIKILVKDTGKGIPQSDQINIFNAFEQAKDQKISEYGGTGLGLALCKQLVNVLGGELTVNSSPGKGSVFQCYFPDVKVMPAQSLVEKLSARHSMGSLEFSTATILVVDDNAINRDLMVTYLSEWNFEVLHAEHGKQAVELANQHLPDLIFMDMKMPVMDGFEATLRLKADPRTQHIPVVAATASALTVEKERIQEITDDYLSKPIEYDSLVNCLCKFISYGQKLPESVQPSQNQRVLIVDDDNMNRLILSDLLGDWKNLEISTACSGEDAIKLACVPERPDLIFMDCQMPGMNGIEAAQKIREWESETSTPSIKMYLATAYTKDEMETKGWAELFNGMLSKPFAIEDVTRLLGECTSGSLQQ